MDISFFGICVLVIIVTTLWSMYDDHEHKTGNLPLISLGYLFLWVVAFPYYLIQRKKAIESAKENPETFTDNVRYMFYCITAIHLMGLTALWYEVNNEDACDSDLVVSILPQVFNSNLVFSEMTTLNDEYRGYDVTIPSDANVCMVKASYPNSSHVYTYHYVTYKSDGNVWVKEIN